MWCFIACLLKKTEKEKEKEKYVKWKERMLVVLYLVVSLVVVILFICVIKRPGQIFATSYISHFLPIHLATLQPWSPFDLHSCLALIGEGSI